MNDRMLPYDWFREPLPENVVLGEGSWLYSAFAFRHFRSRLPAAVRVGRDSGIYNGTFFDLGPCGEVAIGDFCTIVGAVISSNSRIVIGDYTLVSHEVVIADSFAAVPPGERMNELKPRDGRSGRGASAVWIGENVWIGARAILLGGARIGEGSVVGAGSLVDSEIPPYTVVIGNPARAVKRLRPRTS